MQYLDQLSLSVPTIFATLAGAMLILLYIVSKLVYVERGILPLAMKGVGKFFEIIFTEVRYFGGFLFGYTKEQVDDFLANENLLKGMANTITGVAIVLVLFSFLASYSASRDFVISRGISENIAFAIPLGIDGFIVLLILFISYQSLKGEGTIFGRVFLFVFTAMSIYFNISHLEPDASVWNMALITAGAIAPAIVFIGMEVVSAVQKAQVLRSGLVTTDEALRQRILDHELALAIKDEEIENQERELGQAQMKTEAQYGILKGVEEGISTLREEQAYLESLIQKLDREFVDRVPAGEDRLIKVRSLLDQGLDIPEIAEALNVQVKSARSYVRTVQNGSV